MPTPNPKRTSRTLLFENYECFTRDGARKQVAAALECGANRIVVPGWMGRGTCWPNCTVDDPTAAPGTKVTRDRRVYGQSKTIDPANPDPLQYLIDVAHDPATYLPWVAPGTRVDVGIFFQVARRDNDAYSPGGMNGGGASSPWNVYSPVHTIRGFTATPGGLPANTLQYAGTPIAAEYSTYDIHNSAFMTLLAALVDDVLTQYYVDEICFDFFRCINFPVSAAHAASYNTLTGRTLYTDTTSNPVTGGTGGDLQHADGGGGSFLKCAASPSSSTADLSFTIRNALHAWNKGPIEALLSLTMTKVRSLLSADPNRPAIIVTGAGFPGFYEDRRAQGQDACDLVNNGFLHNVYAQWYSDEDSPGQVLAYTRSLGGRPSDEGASMADPRNIIPIVNTSEFPNAWLRDPDTICEMVRMAQAWWGGDPVTGEDEGPVCIYVGQTLDQMAVKTGFALLGGNYTLTIEGEGSVQIGAPVNKTAAEGSPASFTLGAGATVQFSRTGVVTKATLTSSNGGDAGTVTNFNANWYDSGPVPNQDPSYRENSSYRYFPRWLRQALTDPTDGPFRAPAVPRTYIAAAEAAPNTAKYRTHPTWAQDNRLYTLDDTGAGTATDRLRPASQALNVLPDDLKQVEHRGTQVQYEMSGVTIPVHCSLVAKKKARFDGFGS